MSPNLAQGKGFPYVVSGGESNDPNNPIGQITTKNNQFRMAGTSSTSKYLWCYTSTVNNVDGYISSCGSNKDWTVQYDFTTVN